LAAEARNPEQLGFSGRREAIVQSPAAGLQGTPPKKRLPLRISSGLELGVAKAANIILVSYQKRQSELTTPL